MTRMTPEREQEIRDAVEIATARMKAETFHERERAIGNMPDYAFELLAELDMIRREGK